MGPDLEKSQVANEVLTRKDNATVNPNEEDNIVQCMSNYEDNNFHEEVVNDGLAEVAAETEDVEVNIVGCTKSDENVETEEGICGDCAESMSSFGATLSQNENGSLQDDMEVESKLRFDGVLNPTWAFDDISGEFPVRRKKLTDHWRRFIRPLMWRCKWLELQIKEIQSQAQKYDRRLAGYGERQLLDSVEGVETKSLPFCSPAKREKIMKRKKRKRVEETTDMASYMLQHNLFSYYENKKSAASRVLMNDDCSNLDKAVNATDEFGLQEEWPSFDCKGGDNINENSLRKIELLQSQVRKLKARIEKVERDNPGKFWLTMPETDDMLTNSSPTESRDQITAKSKTTGDVLLESAVSSHGEVVPVSDLIESTSQLQTREGILTDKAVVKEETRDLTNYGIQLVEKPRELVEKQTSGDEMPMDTLPARVNFGGKTLPKHRINITYSKRSRTRRTSAKAGWNSKR